MTDSRRLAAAVAGQAVRLRDALPQAGAIQRAALRSWVEARADTAFGRAHEIASITDLADWQRRIPIQDAETLAPWVARAAAGEADVLFAGRAVAIELTGGSTTGPRRVAYGRGSLAEFQQAALPWLDDLFTGQPALVGRPAYWAISPVGRGPDATGAQHAADGVSGRPRR